MCVFANLSGYIQVYVTPSESQEIHFYARSADALAISFQQCAGSKYLHLDIVYNDKAIIDEALSSNGCKRVRTGV